MSEQQQEQVTDTLLAHVESKHQGSLIDWANMTPAKRALLHGHINHKRLEHDHKYEGTAAHAR